MWDFLFVVPFIFGWIPTAPGTRRGSFQAEGQDDGAAGCVGLTQGELLWGAERHLGIGVRNFCAGCVCVCVDSFSDSFGFSVRDFSTIGCIFVEMLRHLRTQIRIQLRDDRAWCRQGMAGPALSWPPQLLADFHRLG